MKFKTASRVLARRVMSRLPPRVFRSVPSALGRDRLLAFYSGAVEIHPKAFQTTTRGNIRFEGNTRDIIQRTVYVYGVWEPEISDWVKDHLRPGDLVLDVGANWGYFSLLTSSIVGQAGRVIGVEPIPTIYEAFLRNIELNEAHNISPTNLLLGDSPGEVEVFLSGAGNLGNSSTVREAGFRSVGSVRSIRGDDLEGVDADRLRLIKVDTEGDEYRVLSGLQGTISRMPQGAAVLVEITPEKLALRDNAPSDIWSLFGADEWDRYVVINDYSLASYTDSDLKPPTRLNDVPTSRVDVIFIKT